MRFFTITISFYILVVSLLPCGDMSECHENTKVSFSASTNHDNHKHDNETCSPFCICSCCGSTVINLDNMATFSDFVLLHSKAFPVFKQTFISVEYFHIWQPPKIS